MSVTFEVQNNNTRYCTVLGAKHTMWSLAYLLCYFKQERLSLRQFYRRGHWVPTAPPTQEVAEATSSLGLLPFFHNTSSLQSGKKTSAANLSRFVTSSSPGRVGNYHIWGQFTSNYHAPANSCRPERRGRQAARRRSMHFFIERDWIMTSGMLVAGTRPILSGNWEPKYLLRTNYVSNHQESSRRGKRGGKWI